MPTEAGGIPQDSLGADFDRVLALRQAEADEFYAELTPDAASADEAMILRQASAGLLWSKQLYYYDVGRWLGGDPGQPPPPEERLAGRNCHWRTFDAFDIMSNGSTPGSPPGTSRFIAWHWRTWIPRSRSTS